MRRAGVILVAAAVVLTAAPAAGQPQLPSGRAGSRNLQGDTSAWRADPHLRTFYEAVKAACAAGCARADRPALEARSRMIFGEMAAARGMNPVAMQDHLKAVPAQMLKLGEEDPAVLSSFDAFILALFGPE